MALGRESAWYDEFSPISCQCSQPSSFFTVKYTRLSRSVEADPTWYSFTFIYS